MMVGMKLMDTTLIGRASNKPCGEWRRLFYALKGSVSVRVEVVHANYIIQLFSNALYTEVTYGSFDILSVVGTKSATARQMRMYFLLTYVRI